MVPELNTPPPPPVVAPQLVPPIILRRVAKPRGWFEIANLSGQALRNRQQLWSRDPRNRDLPFPEIFWSLHFKNADGECAICLDDFGEMDATRLACGHAFHANMYVFVKNGKMY